jgi:hypothetical protein
MEFLSGLSSKIDDAGEMLAKASPALQQQVTQKVLAQFGTKITNQMEQLRASKAFLERGLRSAANQQQGLRQRINELEQVISKIEDPTAKSDKIFKLNEMRDKLDELTGTLEINGEKLKYIEDKLIPAVGEFHNKLQKGGYKEAIDYIKHAEDTILQPTTGTVESKNALLQELSKVQDFVNKLKGETSKFVPEAASELLKSSNLDSARAILKEYAHNKATMSEKMLKLWESNAENAAMLEKIDNSLYGSKFKELLGKIKTTETPRKFAGSFAGQSPKEIAQTIGVPGAVGLVAGSMGVFSLFGWFSDSGLVYIGSEAGRILNKLEKLQASSDGTKIIQATAKYLTLIQTATQDITLDLKSNIEKAINEDLNNLFESTNNLVAVFNQWPTVISGASDSRLAEEIGNDIGHLLKKIGEENTKLIAELEKAKGL